MTNRPVRRWALAVLLPFALVAAACGDDDDDGTDTGAATTEAGSEETTTTADGGGGDAACSSATAPDDAPEIVIGAQDFGESKFMAELYKQCFEAAGYSVSIQELGGFRDLEVSAFESGDINFAPEYAASMLEFLNGDETEATGDVDETLGFLEPRLEEISLVALAASDAVDTNSFVVTQETSDELGLTSLSDLAGNEGALTLGAPEDCTTNPFCIPGLLEVYGVDLSGGFVALDTAVIADALDAGEIDIALLFSTDSRIATNGWVLLEDDQSMLSADNILPIATAEIAEVEGLAELADVVSATLTTENVTEMNRRFDVDTEDADVIAADFLSEQGLV